jgi:membrane-associated protease RseP (regulator of RpoE activity)
MNRKVWTIAAGTVALCAAMVAAPGYTAGHRAQSVETQDAPRTEVRKLVISSGDEGGSWLGVETMDVTAERAKELKLPAERGAVIGKVAPDSPASKAGLKENDVVTELNGQHVEGALQFRRMIRETPAGRNVQMTVWREGRTQTLSATLAQAEGRRFGNRMKATPGTFAFRMPEMPELPEVAELPELPEVLEMPDGPETPDVPGVPGMRFDGNALFIGHPRLGIDAQDLNGQLGSFFGAPEGEGILVRSVNSGSPAEKAGLKAGDVITSVNGDRVRSVGDLRQRLSATRSEKGSDQKDAKNANVNVGVLRNKTEMSLNVELPSEPAHTKHIIARRTNI